MCAARRSVLFYPLYTYNNMYSCGSGDYHRGFVTVTVQCKQNASMYNFNAYVRDGEWRLGGDRLATQAVAYGPG